MVFLECNLCRDAAVEPVLNCCGHIFCDPCLRTEFRRRRHGACRCPACGRRASPSRVIPIYGQEGWSEPAEEIRPGCSLEDGCPAGWSDDAADMMDIDVAEAADDPAVANVVMMDVDGRTTEADGRGPRDVEPMDVVDGGRDNQALEGNGGGAGQETQKQKVVPLECHICLDDAEDPVATPCGHVYCTPCLFQWLDGRRRKCPMCKNPVSESTVTLVFATPDDGGEMRRNREAQQV